MTFRLVDVGYSLPEGQAVKLIFFAPWFCTESVACKEVAVVVVLTENVV